MLLLSAKYSGSFSDGKTPYERPFGVPFNVPVIPFGAITLFLGKTNLDCISLEQKSCQVYFSVMHRTRGDASELHARRLNAKEVSAPMKGEKFIFPIADGTVKISGGDQRLRTSTLIRDRPDRGEEQGIFQGESDEFSSNPHQSFFVIVKLKMTQHWMMRKLEMTSGLFLEILFTVIMWNPESNYSCREKSHFLFRWNISTLPEIPIHP